MSNFFQQGVNFCHPCRPSHPCPPFPPQPPLPANIDVRVNSATGGAGPLPINSCMPGPISLVSVTIDTTGMRKTRNLLIFTSQINLPLGIGVTLNFEVFRSLDGGIPAKVGSTYTFSTQAAVLESEAFSFQVLDDNLPEGTYTYSVQISSTSAPGLTITNATLSVLAIRI